MPFMASFSPAYIIFPSLTLSVLIAEPDILRFPLSLVTTAALFEGIIACLVAKYEHEAQWHHEVTRRRRPGQIGLSNHMLESAAQLYESRVNRAKRESEGAIHDIQILLCITDVSIFLHSSKVLPLNPASGEIRRMSALAGN